MLIKGQWFYEINAQWQRPILNSRHMGLLKRKSLNNYKTTHLYENRVTDLQSWEKQTGINHIKNVSIFFENTIY